MINWLIIWNIRMMNSSCFWKANRKRENAKAAGIVTSRFPSVANKVILKELKR